MKEEKIMRLHQLATLLMLSVGIVITEGKWQWNFKYIFGVVIVLFGCIFWVFQDNFYRDYAKKNKTQRGKNDK